MVRFGPLGASVTVTLPPPGDDDAPAPSADRHDRARRPPTALDDDALLRALDDDGDDASSSAVRVRRGLILQSEIAYFRGARGADVLRGERLRAFVSRVRDDGRLLSLCCKYNTQTGHSADPIGALRLPRTEGARGARRGARGSVFFDL